MSALGYARNLGPFSNVHFGFRNILMRTFMFGVVGSLAMFISSWEKSDRMKDQLFETHVDYGDTFDFIIVGAGTSGSLIANRLSQHYRVLLLEAGGDPHPFQNIPMFSSYMLNYKELDWMHKTIPQKRSCQSTYNKQAGISQGKSLGGTSNLNFMQHTRGSPLDYDQWAELIKDNEWKYDNLLPYFKKHEEYVANGPWSRKDHGFNGDMRIETPDYIGMASDFIAAGKEMGYKRVDLNGKFTEGFDTATYAMKRGHRQSTFSSFIKPIRPRWNLVIYKYAHVNRILLKMNNGTQSAYGIEYDRHGKRKFAFAKKEIIISAGAIQSPKLLMLSGIGPKDHLESLDIPVKVDQPNVGKNLQDHLSTFLGPFIMRSPKTLLVDRDINSQALIQFSSINSRGPLTTTGIQASALISSSRSKRHSKSQNSNSIWPDLHLSLYGMANHESYAQDMSHAYRLNEEMVSNYMTHTKGKHSFSIIVSAGRPESRGVVELQDRDPYSDPIVDTNYLDKEYDMDTMIEGIRKSIFLVENTTTFQRLGARFTTEMLPGCESYLFRSEAYFDCFIRRYSVSMGNVAGTVCMGGALDSKLRVLGVNRLRVIDASSMPTIVASGTQAATLVIGEKGSDMILKYWGIPLEKEIVGTLHVEDYLEKENKTEEIKNDVKRLTQSKLLIKSTSGFQGLSSVDSDFIYNNVPTSEKPSTLKYGRSAVVDPSGNNSTHTNKVGDHSAAYPYSSYFPTEKIRPVVHIKDRNIPQTPSTSARTIPISYSDRAMENYFSEAATTTLEPEEDKINDEREKRRESNKDKIFKTTSTTTVKTTTRNYKIEEPQYITYPIEIVSHSSSNPNHEVVIQTGNQVVVPLESSSVPSSSIPPVRFSKKGSSRPVNNYKYTTNQILRETMPLLSQRNKDNPIFQYQNYQQEQDVPMRYSISPYSQKTNTESLRDNVAKYLSPFQTQRLAGQTSFIVNNEPVKLSSGSMNRENKQQLRESVFKILNPNEKFPTTTTIRPPPNSLKQIFAPFSKLFETPLRFVKDPVKFVSDPLKFVAGHIKLVTDPLSRAVPEPFSQVIQAPTNFMERIHNILNASKKQSFQAFQGKSNEYNFGSTLLSTTLRSTGRETTPKPYGFSYTVTDAALNSHDLPTTNNPPPPTTEKPNSFNIFQFASASTPQPQKFLVDNRAVSSSALNHVKYPPKKSFFPVAQSPPPKITTSFINNGYHDHHTSFNNSFDYTLFSTPSSSEVSSERPPKDYELVETDSIPIGDHHVIPESLKSSETHKQQDLHGKLNENLKIIYQRPYPQKESVPYEIFNDKFNPPSSPILVNENLEIKNIQHQTIASTTNVPKVLERPLAVYDKLKKASKIFKNVVPTPQETTTTPLPYTIIPQNEDKPLVEIPEEILKQISAQFSGNNPQILPSDFSLPQHLLPDQFELLPSNFQLNPPTQPQQLEPAPPQNFPGSQILKVNTNENNDHLPEEVKQLLASQNVEKGTQVYILLSDQSNVGENFENIPNFKDIINQFPKGTEVKSLLNTNTEYSTTSTTSTTTELPSSTTKKSVPRRRKPENTTKKSIVRFQENSPVVGVESPTAEILPTTQQSYVETPWNLDAITSSTDNPALSFKIQILKPKT